MKVYTIINPLFEGLKEVPSPCGSAYVNVKLIQERKKKREQQKALEDYGIIDAIYDIPNIDVDWM